MTDQHTTDLDAWIGRNVIGEEPRMSCGTGWRAGIEFWPPYSTDDGLALRVVEKMRAEGWDCELFWPAAIGLARCTFSLDHRAYTGRNTIAATAICLSAKAAKEAARA